MTTTERATVVGVFIENTRAEQAIADLRSAGFTDEQIGFVARNNRDTSATNEDTGDSAKGAAVGALGGGLIGGLLGATVALLVPGFGPAIAGGVLVATIGGAAMGATAGGFVGALTALGVPEEEATYYQDELETGRTIVTVNAPGRYQEALDLLRQNGAYDASTRPATRPVGDPYMQSGRVQPGTNTAIPSSSYEDAAVIDTEQPEMQSSRITNAYDPTTQGGATTGSQKPTEQQEAINPAYTPDSLAHNEEAQERPAHSNIPSGSM